MRLRDHAGTLVSIHAPRAGRDPLDSRGDCTGDVSIHAPRAGRDCRCGCATMPERLFQSTRPVRGATPSILEGTARVMFQSTRPVRGATTTSFSDLPESPRFNPRAPCGARPDLRQSPAGGKDVSIHAPRAGRDQGRQRPATGRSVSIHAPRAGRDPGVEPSIASNCVSIHAPRAGRDLGYFQVVRDSDVSIHAPRAGRDRGAFSTMRGACRFNPRAPCGARHKLFRGGYYAESFQSTRPVRGATCMRPLSL